MPSRMTPSFPVEIMQLIFDDVHPDTNKTISAALAISSVSQYWRAAALSTPSLWSTFSFCLRTHDKDMLSALLERSRPSYLDITVTFAFSDAEQCHAGNVQRAIALLRGEAERVVRLRLCFLDHLHGGAPSLAQLIGFRSSTLKYLEINSLHHDPRHRHLLSTDLSSLTDMHQCWSELCPALTHITCTDPGLLLHCPSQITFLCITGVPGQQNTLLFAVLRAVLQKTEALTELIIDGVSLYDVRHFHPLPHLRALSLRGSPSPDGGLSDNDAWRLALFLGWLDAPALASLVIHNAAIPTFFERMSVHHPSVTRVTCAPQSLSCFPAAFPRVEELVLRGSDSEFRRLAGISGDAWPHLRMIDLTEVERPPHPCLKGFSENLYEFGRGRIAAGHGSRLEVRLPRGIMPEDLLLDVSEFIDLQAA